MTKNILSILLFLSVNTFAQDITCVDFSHEPGFYDSSFYLKTDVCQGVLLYSFENDLTKKSKKFPDSLLIDNTTTITFLHLIGDSSSHLGSVTFFIQFDTKFKVVALSIAEADFFNSRYGIYVDGPRAWFDTIKEHKVNANYLYKNDKWERDIFIEIFDANKRIINQNAGVRIFGGMTRLYPEKSLRIIARGQYGESRFSGDIFGEGGKKYKQIILRNSGNDYRKTRFKDALSTSLAAESQLDIQKNEPCHLFINSEYWGVYNIREKINKFYFENNYGISKTGIDILHGHGSVEEGDDKEYKHLLNYIKRNNMKSSVSFQHVDSLMDIRNYINFWIYQLYFSNSDVRGNIRWWRSDSLDGKFRWIVYDTDLGFSPSRANRNFLADFTSSYQTKWYNAKWATFLLRNLFKNKSFEKDFVNQACYLLSSSLSTSHVLTVIDKFYNTYEDEMKIHFLNRRAFQRNQGSIESWRKHVENLREFARAKTAYFYSHIKNQFKLDETYTLNIKIDNLENGQVLLNGNKLLNQNFTGLFFNSYSIPIQIIPDLGYHYKGWEQNTIINKENEDVIINISFIQNKKSEKKIIINEIDYQNDCFEIFNQGNQTINLKGWKILDKNNNLFTIEDCILKKGRFAVFHFRDIDEKIDSVIYIKMNFKISSSNELIALYDNNSHFVDMVHYQLTALENSYSRNIPFEKVDEINVIWNNNSDFTIGYHNRFYAQILSDKLQKEIQETKKRRILYLCYGMIIPVSFLFVFLLHKKKREQL